MRQLNKCVLKVAPLLVAMTASGQNLPNVQVTSIYTSDNIKIDGRLTEWGEKFQAFNHATEIYYTISNDDNNIYVAIRAYQPDVINRIVGGGITFKINTFKNKKDKNAVSITYPYMEGGFPPLFFLSGKTFTGLSESDLQQKMAQYNTTLQKNFKSIGVKGMADLDGAISIYNEAGIKAAGLFDDEKHYNVEFALPIKYLSALIGSNSPITYHLVIGGRENMPTIEAMPGQTAPPFIARVNRRQMILSGVTDFWGEYTLAKKN